MRSLLLALTALLGTALAEGPFGEVEAVRSSLGPWRGVIVLRDCSSGEVLRTDEVLANKPLPPCSTFKIWNSAIGLETGLVGGPDEPFWQWDGEKRFLDTWNRDQTLRSAFQASCVPAYQNLARQIGAERMQAWLTKLAYGDADMSAGVDVFWLPKPDRKTVMITPEQQAALLCRLASGKLPLSAATLTTLREVMVAEQTDKGTLYGKTGSGTHEGLKIGWYVGYGVHGGQTTAFAILVTGPGAAGTEAREVAKAVFQEQGWL